MPEGQPELLNSACRPYGQGPALPSHRKSPRTSDSPRLGGGPASHQRRLPTTSVDCMPQGNRCSLRDATPDTSTSIRRRRILIGKLALTLRPSAQSPCELLHDQIHGGPQEPQHDQDLLHPRPDQHSDQVQ